MTSSPRKFLSRGNFWLVVIILATFTSLASLRYVAGGSAVPPPLRENFQANQALFLLHISLGSIALLIGPWQFSKKLRVKKTPLHRIAGRVYVGACLLGGAAGLAIAPGSNGGPIATTGFSALAVFWIGTTFMGYLSARRRDFPAHQRWMLLSFSLTLAGVTLRLYLPLALINLEKFSEVYAVIAWACWVPNLLVGYWLARR